MEVREGTLIALVGGNENGTLFRHHFPSGQLEDAPLVPTELIGLVPIVLAEATADMVTEIADAGLDLAGAAWKML